MSKTAKVEKVVDVEKEVISKEEQAIIEQARVDKKRTDGCNKEILAVLQKYRCDISVNMNSPVGRPTVKLVLLK